METTSHNTNMNFNTFLKDTSLIILNRILAIITLLFVIASSVCLFLAHICLSVACYIEDYMLVGFGFSSDENGCLHHYIYHLNDIVRDKINLYIVKGDKVIIKEEIIEDIKNRLGPGDWVLVKGSRGMAMETIVQELLDWANQ